jgi:hypothetical protein
MRSVDQTNWGDLNWADLNWADHQYRTGGRIRTNLERLRWNRFLSRRRVAQGFDDRRFCPRRPRCHRYDWHRHCDSHHRGRWVGERAADRCCCCVEGERPSLVLRHHLASCRQTGVDGRDGLDPIPQKLRRPDQSLQRHRHRRHWIDHRHRRAYPVNCPNSSLVAPKGRDDLTGGNQQALREFRRRSVTLVAKGLNGGRWSPGRGRPAPLSPRPSAATPDPPTGPAHMLPRPE